MGIDYGANWHFSSDPSVQVIGLAQSHDFARISGDALLVADGIKLAVSEPRPSVGALWLDLQTGIVEPPRSVSNDKHVVRHWKITLPVSDTDEVDVALSSER